jgi:NAD(P)-dependent dehydrogenase (short-subunit alcohol dehydrogenase family)
MAERFAREGASVIVVGRNEEKGRAVAKKNCGFWGSCTLYKK